MAKRWKILSLLLALVMTLGVLAGCRKEEEPPSNDPIDTTPQPLVDTIDLSEYAIVRPYDGAEDKVSTLLMDSITSFKTALDTLTGSDVEMLVDTEVPQDAAAKEILIGLTDRPESQTAMNELPEGKHAFNIRKIGNKLTIVGHTQELVTKGLNYLAQTYASKSEGDGTFDIDVNLNYTKAYKYHEIIKESMPQYEVIYGMTANNSVKSTAENLWNFVNRMTEQKAVLGTDYYRPSNGIEELFSRSCIVVGTTNHPRTQELMATADYFSWAVETDHDQIYLFGTDNDSVKAVCQYMQTLIGGCKLEGDATTIRICKGEPIVGSGNEWGNQIPKFNGGTMDSVEEFQEYYYRLYYTGVTRASYNEYQAKVLGAGYTLYGSNTLEGNVYKTYKNDSMMIHTYYLANENAVSVAMTPLQYFTDYPTKPVSDGTVTETKMGVVSMDYAKISNTDGSGFIFTMADGSYVIIDGGHGRKTTSVATDIPVFDKDGNPTYDENGKIIYQKKTEVTYEGTSKKIYDYLKENNKRPNGEILIRAWIITNAKTDHYGAFANFAEDYASKVTLQYFVAQFDYEKQIKTGTADGGSGVNAGNGADVKRIMDAKKLFKDSKHIVPLAGQRMYFGTMEVTFLYAAEVFCHANPDNVGDHSLVFRAVFGDSEDASENNSFLFVSDIGLDVLKILTKNYTSATLKSDFVQAPNHGDTGQIGFWMATMPKYLLLGTTREGADLATTNNKAFIQYVLTLVDEFGDPVVKKVFSGENRFGVENTDVPFIFDILMSNPLYDYGDHEEDRDEIDWGDMSQGEVEMPDPDHRPGDYDEDRDSTSWEDMVSPATA